MKNKRIDKNIFIVCLGVAILLFVGSFLCPPPGEIHPSCLKAASILAVFAALGIAGQSLADGKEVKFHKDDMDLTIGDDDKKESDHEDTY